MVFPFPELAGNYASVICVILGIAAAVVLITRTSRDPNASQLGGFPTVGSSGSQWRFGSRLQDDVAGAIQEGYDKYKPIPFKVAYRHRWLVILSNPKHLEELSVAPEEELSISQAIEDQANFRHMLGQEVLGNPYHVTVIRSHLTRNTRTIYPQLKDEIVTSFDEVLDLRNSEWKSIPALKAVQEVVCRAINRPFVGLPLCRHPDWIDLNIQCTLHIIQESFLIGVFPELLKPLAACLFTSVARDIKRGMKHLGPTIEERLKLMDEYGDQWAEKPNDLLSWLMEEAKGPELTVKALVIRMLFINFSAIHTSSGSFTHALFYLAANPQYIQPLRDEIESIVKKEGWSKAALSEMRKVDSFIRECQRVEVTNVLGLSRKVLKDFMFSDGTFLPKGTMIGAPIQSLQCDGKFYKNADVFDPFRFVQEDGERLKSQLVSTGIEYLPFGHGKHACPGRFFAGISLKFMLAHLIVTYDIKFEGNAVFPGSLHVGTLVTPNPYAEVLFRKRSTEQFSLY